MMELAHFRFSTDILKRLGEELNPSLDQGILELVKNSYDADAHNCKIEIINCAGNSYSIRIVDDGVGMTVDEIKNGWLVLGHSEKTKSERTNLGRVPAGSKGLGRLAALRMGEAVTLYTIPKTLKNSINHIKIKWSEFDRVDLVDDIELKITSKANKEQKSSGTEIVLENVKVELTRSDIKKLARSLILLADPFGDNPYGFEPILEAPEFKDLEDLVSKRYFTEADYYLIANVNDKGKANAKVVDWKGKALFSATHDELANLRNIKKYNCPPAKFDFWAFILDKSSFSTKSTTVQEVREWLQMFGGVHLYENNLRVSPYGNPGNDWLDINLRRVQSPEVRPGTNTSIGRIAVSDLSGLLNQKTDRSGYIESEVFQELRLFAQDALEWMAKERIKLRNKRRIQDRTQAAKESSMAKKKIDDVIEEMPEDSKNTIKKAINDFEKSKEKEIRTLKKEVQLYRTLSTAGITSATFAHESSGNPIKAITQGIKAIERRGKKKCSENYDGFLKKPVEGIKRAVSSLSVLGQFTLKLLDHSKRRVGRVNIHEVIRNVVDIFFPFLSGRDVKMEINLCKGNPYLRGSEAEVESIFANLINNSLNALEEDNTSKKIISIESEIQNDLLIVRVGDNGPGIKERNLKDIWLAGYSTKVNGTGLGLTIVKDAIVDLDGDITVVPKGTYGGAEFIIEFPIIGI